MEVSMTSLEMVDDSHYFERVSFGLSAAIRELGGRILISDWKEGWCEFSISVDALVKKLNLPAQALHTIYGEFTFRIYRFEDDNAWYLNLPKMLVFNHGCKDRWMSESMEVMIEQGQVQFLVCDKFLTLRSLVCVGLIPVTDGLMVTIARLVNSWEMLLERLRLSESSQLPRLTREVQKAVFFSSMDLRTLNFASSAMVMLLNTWWSLLTWLEPMQQWFGLFLSAMRLRIQNSRWSASRITIVLLLVFLGRTVLPNPSSSDQFVTMARKLGRVEKKVSKIEPKLNGVELKKGEPRILEREDEKRFRILSQKQVRTERSLFDARMVLRSLDRVFIPNLTSTKHLGFLASQGFDLVAYLDGTIIYFVRHVETGKLSQIKDWYPTAKFCPANSKCAEIDKASSGVKLSFASLKE
jgi:hypothetical protein